MVQKLGISSTLCFWKSPLIKQLYCKLLLIFRINIFTFTFLLWLQSYDRSHQKHTLKPGLHMYVCESPATKLRCDIQFTNDKMYSSFFNSIQNFTSTQCYEESQSSKTDTNTHPQLQTYPPFQDFITYYCNNTFTIQYSLGYYYRK